MCYAEQMGSAGTAPNSLNLSTRWKWVVNAICRSHYAQAELWYSFQKAGWAPALVWTGFGDSKIFFLTGVWSSDYPAHIESLYRLHYPGPTTYVKLICEQLKLYSLEIFTIRASRSSVWSHVTVTCIWIPLLYTYTTICADIVTALCTGTWKSDSY
jgi:hypothetical protein